MSDVKVYSFIDTDVFVRSLLGNSCEDVLSTLLSKIDEAKLVLIVPDIIKMEILYLFSKKKGEKLELVADNLEIKRILGIQDQNTDDKKRNRNSSAVIPTREVTNTEKLQEIISKDREALLSKVETYYQTMYKKLENIFQHKNTIIVEVTGELMLRGMKRSLLKIPPFSDKATEQSRTKDADCIAYESLLTVVNSDTIGSSDVLAMCISDKDYRDKNGVVYDVIKNELKVKVPNTRYYIELADLLSKEFDESVDENNKTEIVENVPVPSLASDDDQLDTKIASSGTVSL